MKTPRAMLVATLCAIATPPGAPAQITPADSQSQALADLSIEELMGYRIEKVYSASKYEQRVTRAPASVSIVTSTEIRDYGHRTLSDVLRSVRGLFVSADGNYEYLGVRGFLRPGDYNTRVQMLVDGHRMNDVIYDGVYFGHDNPADIDMIDRVEVIRGPSSSIYGNSAFFGVVNIITRQPSQFDGVEVSAEAGSFDSRKMRVTYGRQFREDASVLFNISWFESDGLEHIYYPEFDERISSDSRARSNGFATGADSEGSFKLSTTATFGPFKFTGLYARRSKDVPTASFFTHFDSGMETTTDERAYADLGYEHEFSQDLRLAANVSFDHHGYSGDYPYDFAEPGDPADIVVSKDKAHGDWATASVQLTARLRDKHTIVAGGELRYTFSQEQESYYETVPLVYDVSVDKRTRTLGIFAQGEFELHPKLLLNAGIRYDYYPDGFGDTFNPRLGLIYNPAANTTIKALYGRAYRAPNTYERFYFAQDQDTIDPERIRTAELVVEHYFANDVHASLSGYNYEVTGLISQLDTVDGGIYFDNRDITKARGLELEVGGRFQSGIQVRASLAVQRTEDRATGAELTNSPRQLAKLNISAPLAGERLRAGLELQSHASVQTLDGSRADSFILTNLTFTSRELLPGFEVSASVYNLFDEEYGYPGAEDHAQDILPQPGRSFRIRATFRF